MGGFLVCLAIFSAAAQARLNVVATTADLGAIARTIGADRVDVASLAKPTEDAHFVEAKPSFVLKLSRADLLIEGGAELESAWLVPLIEGARNPKLQAGTPGRLRCAEGLSMLEVPATLDRSRGDIHAAGNPHYLVDPENGAIVAQRIAEALSRLDAASATFYQSNLERFKTSLTAHASEWRALLAPFQNQRVIAYHNTWPYFAKRFGLRIDLFLEPKPGIPPSPGHLTGIIQQIKAEKITAIIVEPYQSRRTAERVAAETGARVVELTQYPGGLKGTEGGYIELIDYLVRSLAKALAGS